MKKNRLEAMLYQILTPYGICHDARLFSHWLQTYLGLSQQESSQMYPFSLRYDKSIGFYLNLGQITASELLQLLNLFDLKPETYRLGKPIPVNEEWIINTVLPSFKEFLDSENNKEALKPFLQEGLFGLPINIYQELRWIATKLLKLIKDESDPLHQQVTRILFISETVGRNPKDEKALKRFIEVFNELKDRVKNYKFQSNEIKGYYDQLIWNFEMYFRFERSKQVRLCSAVFTRVQDTFRSLNITDPDFKVFHEAWLTITGIKNRPEKIAFEKAIGDETRLFFCLYGSNKEDANRFGNYFKEAGDKTMKIWQDSYASISAKDKAPLPPLHTYIIDLDAEFFHDNMLPRFDSYVEQLTKQETEASSAHQGFFNSAKRVVVNEVEEFNLVFDN